MSELYEERVMEMMSNQKESPGLVPKTWESIPEAHKPPDYEPLVFTKEMDARARFPVPQTDPNLVLVRYSDGRSVWERDSREDIKALVTRILFLENRVQALEAKP